MTTFGQRDVYYARKPNPRAQSYSQASRLIEEVLGQHDDGLKDRVQRTYKRWNQQIRHLLVEETALRLTSGPDRQSVPVKVQDGLPLPFEHVVNQFDDPLLWELLLSRGALTTTVHVLDRFGPRLGAVQDVLEIESDRTPTPEQAEAIRALLEAALVQLDVHPVVEQLSKIPVDYLGAYYFHVPEVHLYWKVIGVVAGFLDVPVEALTVVTLAHELAHAYTHLGYDIDGGVWPLKDFAGADLHIVEGLAQFYTAAICVRLEERLPSAKEAFITLAHKQAPPYNAHRAWCKGLRRKGEVIRSAMLETRAAGVRDHGAFSDLLDVYADRISGSSSRRGRVRYPTILDE